MKLAYKLLAIVFIFLFLWMMFVTTSPIRPNRVEHFSACDVTNSSSWDASDGDLIINSTKSLLETSKNHIEFDYKHPPRYEGQPILFCKFPIPEMILYRAITLSVTYKLNQPAFFDIGIRRFGQGPGWKPVKVEGDQVNKIITSTWLLHIPEQPKLNWLSGSYDGVTFGVTKYDKSKELILTIYQVYLE